VLKQRDCNESRFNGFFILSAKTMVLKEIPKLIGEPGHGIEGKPLKRLAPIPL